MEGEGDLVSEGFRVGRVFGALGLGHLASMVYLLPLTNVWSP